MAQPLVVGSQDTLTGTIRDMQDSTLVEIDLTGATVVIRAEVNRGTAKNWAATPDPDQVTYPGKYSYVLQATDIDAPGSIEMQARVSISGRTYYSAIELRDIERAI